MKSRLSKAVLPSIVKPNGFQFVVLIYRSFFSSANARRMLIASTRDRALIAQTRALNAPCF